MLRGKYEFVFSAAFPSPLILTSAPSTANQSCLHENRKSAASHCDRPARISCPAQRPLAPRQITGFKNPLIIIPYLGYGTADKLLFGGRVLEDEGFSPGHKH